GQRGGRLTLAGAQKALRHKGYTRSRSAAAAPRNGPEEPWFAPQKPGPVQLAPGGGGTPRRADASGLLRRCYEQEPTTNGLPATGPITVLVSSRRGVPRTP